MNFNFLKPRSWLGGSIYTRIVQTVVYATVLLVPLLYLPWTSSVLEFNKQVFLIAAAGIGLIAWLLGVVVTGNLTFRTTVADKGILAILGATAVATIFSVVRAHSIFGLTTSSSSALLTIVSLTILYFLAVNTLSDRGQTLSRVLSISMALSLLIGAVQIFGVHLLPGAFTHSSAFNTVGSINALGILAAASLAFFSKAILRNGEMLFDALLASIGLAAAIAILAVINWWVLWAVALVGMLAIVAFDSIDPSHLASYGGRRRRFTLGRFVIPMIVIVLGAFFMLIRFDIAAVKSGFPPEVSPTFGLSWDATNGVLSQRLIYGYGPENVSLAFDHFTASSIAASSARDAKLFNATSQFFNAMIEGGLLALIALACLAWCFIEIIIRFYRAMTDGGTVAPHTSGVLSTLGALTAAFFLYPFNITLMFVAYVLVVLAALAVSADKATSLDIEERPSYALASSVGFIVALIMVLTGTYFVVARYIGDVNYARAFQIQDDQKAFASLQSALSWNSSDDRYLRDTSQAALILARAELQAQTKKSDPERTQRVQNLIASAVQIAQRATETVPVESLNWNNLGLVYQSLSGVIDDVEGSAEAAFRAAADRRPGDPSFANAAGLMWLNRSDALKNLARNSLNAQRISQQSADALAHAESAFKDALVTMPSYGPAIYNLGSVYERQGKIGDAVAQLEKIAPYNTNQAGLMFELGLLYIRANRKDDAVAALQRAVLLSSDYANARWYLGLLLEERGDLDGALAQFEAVQKLNPDNQEVAQEISKIKSGQHSSGRVIDSQPLQ